MDGNRRWAREHNLPERDGHEKGAVSVREVARSCARAGVQWLTLYAFSRENWKRSKIEVSLLMRLLKRYLIDERDEIMENNIRFRAIGRLEDLPAKVIKEYEITRDMSAENTGLTLCLALNYSGQAEITDAARRIARAAVDGSLDPEELNEVTFEHYLYDPDMPPIDLLIRTGGEMRISNFLLWQLSYSELWVTDTAWPAFRAPQLYDAFREFGRRERRFGGQ
jgi:undecaprenyl diphosphate synthase